jgi:hypothetical protein
MSDVLHHARPTQTQAGAISRRLRFLASINAKAVKPPIKYIEPEAPLVPAKIVWRTAEDMAFGPVVIWGAVETILPTCADIVRATAKYFGLPRVEMLSPRRQAELVTARQVAMYLCKMLTLRSYPFIGRALGRDHTTVIHSVCKIQNDIGAGNPVIIAAVNALTAEFGGR